MKKEFDGISYKKRGYKINAPTLAYMTVYGKKPDHALRGRTSSEKKIWNGIDVDIHLKDEWLEELNNLPVEIKSTDEGKSKERVAFVIFRMPQGEDELYKKMQQHLKEEENIYVSSDIGMQNRPRICVAKDIIVGENKWEDWWSLLATKIKRAYNKTTNKDIA
ncbi:MAG: hypothetical protein ACOCQQ_02365 [Candidatus Nanoarchaeia archaeon]